MKNQILKFLILFSVVLSSCSDDEVKKKTITETPLNAYMQTVEAGSVEEYTDNETYSVGYAFKTKKAGLITALGVSAPQAGTYTVSLYDSLTEELVTSTEVVLTEAQIEANPYGFQYSILTEAVSTEADQTFYVVYDMNSGTEEIYRPLIDSHLFQMEGSFIEFQGGIWGYPGGVPTNKSGTTFYTADVTFTY